MSNSELKQYREVIRKGLKVCSFDNYLGKNDDNRNKHSTLGNSAVNSIDKRLDKEKKDLYLFFKSIENTCHKKSHVIKK